MENNLATSQWYILQVMSGQENKVMNSLNYRLEQDRLAGIDNGIDELVIPTEKVETKRKDGKKIQRERKLYPGYILIKVKLFLENGNLDPVAWGIIKETNGVIGFISGSKPTPLPPEDVMLMLQHKEEEVKPVMAFEVGETVVICDGPFVGSEGLIESIDKIHQRLKLSINAFGRSTSCEVEIWQVERPS